MTAPRIEDKITTGALNLGFAAVGIAEVGPAESDLVYQRWLGTRRAADLDYLRRQRELRKDPRNLLPEAKSVICVAARYPVHPQPGIGFAMYARGGDYHEVIRANLRRLAALARQDVPSLKYRICVDSAPLFEREWAVRAGLGWIGRQGQVISPVHGACLLLGELLVNVALTPSDRMPNQCGDCWQCVEACPANAIGEDGLLDARRCVAYLTIEHKGELPAEFQPIIGPSLFGCDRCAAVCPWNPKDEGQIMPELQPREVPTVGQILKMNEPAFRTRFKGTAVFRTGLERLQRNAALTLGAPNPKPEAG